MKNSLNILLLYMFLGLAFAGCQNEPAAEGAADIETDGAAIIQDAEQISSDGMPIITGPSGQISAQTRSMVESLTKNYWYVEQWVEMNQGKMDRDQAKSNRGRWFQFDTQGNVSIGQLKSTTDSGKWEYDPQKAHLVLDMNQSDDMEFSLKMTPDGKVMLWVGTERFNQNNVQLKLENYVEMLAEMPNVSN